MNKNVDIKISLNAQDAVDGLIKISNQAKKTGNDLGSSFDKTTSAAGKATNSFGLMDRAMGVFAGHIYYKAFSLLTTGMANASAEAIEFKKQIAAIETIMNNGEIVTESLKNSLLQLAATYGGTASQQAKSFYSILSSGIDNTEEALNILDNANKLATAGMVDTEKTIGLLTAAHAVYGNKLTNTTEGIDSLFKTAQLGRTTIEALTNTMGKALPMAQKAGLSFDEVGSNLATFSNAGNTTARSVTLLNAILTSFARYGDELGPTMNLAAIETDGFGVVIDRLGKKTGGSSEELIKLLKRQEAVIGVQTLLKQGLEGYNDQLDQYDTKAGVAAEASKKIVSESVQIQWEKLIANLTAAGGGFQNLVTIVNAGIKSLNEFYETDLTGDLDEKVNDTTKEVERLNDMLVRLKKEGGTWQKGFKAASFQTLFGDQFPIDLTNKKLEKTKQVLEELKKARADQLPPMVLEIDEQRLKRQIKEIEDNLTIDPIEKRIKIIQIEEQIQSQNKKDSPLPAKGKSATQSTEGAETAALINYYNQKAAIRKEFDTKEEMESLEFKKRVIDNELTFQKSKNNIQYQEALIKAKSIEDETKKEQAIADAKSNKRIKDKELDLKAISDKAEAESAIQLAINEKKLEEDTAFNEAKKEIQANYENEKLALNIEKYDEMSSLEQERTTIFSDQEKTRIDQLLTTMSLEDAIKIAQMEADIKREDNYAKKMLLIKKKSGAEQIAVEKFTNDTKKEMGEAALDTANYAITAGLAFAKKGTREHKNLLRAQVVMNTAAAAMKAYQESPFPFNFASAGFIIAAGAGQLRNIDQQKFATGGIVGGNGARINGDKVNVAANDREMLLNMQQQRNLFDVANTGMVGNTGMLDVMLDIRNVLSTQSQDFSIDGDKLNNKLQQINNRRLV